MLSELEKWNTLRSFLLVASFFKIYWSEWQELERKWGIHSPSQLFLRIQDRTVFCYKCNFGISTLKEKNIPWLIRMIHMIYKLSIASLGFFLKRENLTPKATWHHCQLKCKTLRSWKKKYQFLDQGRLMWHTENEILVGSGK